MPVLLFVVVRFWHGCRQFVGQERVFVTYFINDCVYGDTIYVTNVILHLF